jgi:guanylate kinase
MDSKIFIITGTSGAGKDSVIEKIKEKGFDFVWAKTTTSRPQREGETEGNPYHFVSPEEFQEKIKNDEMIEYAEVYGMYYGMERKNIEQLLKTGKPVIVRIDIQGVPIYKKTYPDSVCVFISAPSYEILEKRIRSRGKDNEDAIQKRMQVARDEMRDSKSNPLYDYVIVNEENRLEETSEKIIAILKKYDQK